MSVTIKALKNKYPFKFLSERYQQRIANSSVLTQHKPGDILFKLGDDAKFVAYLMWGDVLLKASDGKTSLVKHSQLSAKYPISKLKPRRYTATTSSSQVVILWVDRRLLKECIAKQLLRNQYENTQRSLESGFFELKQQHVIENHAA